MFQEIAQDFQGLGPVKKIFFIFTILILLAFGLYHLGIIKIPQALSRDCNQGMGRDVLVTIENNAFMPQQIHVRVCDRLTFRNDDAIDHEPVVGEHPHHAYYPEFEERLLSKGETSTVVLSRAGAYELHDHLNEEIRASLTIKY